MRAKCVQWEPEIQREIFDIIAGGVISHLQVPRQSTLIVTCDNVTRGQTDRQILLLVDIGSYQGKTVEK